MNAAERRHRTILSAAFSFLLLFSLFFLVRPMLPGGGGYGPRPPGTTYAYSFLVLAAFGPYVAALWAARRGVSLRVAVGGATLLHVVMLPAALTQSQDVYTYLFYGKMWSVYGANPYAALPEAFSFDPWFPWVRWPDQPSVYGPLWMFLMSGVAEVADRLSAAVLLAKASVVAITGTAVAGLVVAARDRGVDPGRAVVLFAWNPLVLISLPLGAHADAAVAAGLLWAVVADRRERPMLAALALTGATLVKAYAGVALAAYLLTLVRRRGPAVRAALVCAGGAALAHAPLWVGATTFSGLARIAGETSASLSGGLQDLLDLVAPADAASTAVRAAGVALLAADLVRISWSRHAAADPWPRAASALAVYVLIAPWFLYWHLVGLLALAAVASSRSVAAGGYAFSATTMLTMSGGTGLGMAAQTLLRYGVPVAAAWRMRTRRTAPVDSPHGPASIPGADGADVPRA